MNRFISYEEAKARVGEATDSTALTVKELREFLDKTDADNVRIYFYKSSKNDRTNFLISAYNRGVENKEVFLGDVEPWRYPYITILEDTTVFK